MNILELTIPADIEVLVMSGLLLGVGVYAVYTIWNDSYFALNERKNVILIIFAVFGVMNIGIGVINIVDGYTFQTGKMTIEGINLLCGLLILVIFLTMLMKKVQSGKDE